MAEYKPVVFNEGAPLDPSKLNEIQTNFTNYVASSASLQNSTDSLIYTLNMDAGSFWTDSLEAGKAYERDIPYGNGFNGVPKIIASIGNQLKVKEVVTISIIDYSGKPRIKVVPNVSRDSVLINWIAFEKK